GKIHVKAESNVVADFAREAALKVGIAFQLLSGNHRRIAELKGGPRQAVLRAAGRVAVRNDETNLGVAQNRRADACHGEELSVRRARAAGSYAQCANVKAFVVARQFYS